MGPLTVLRRGAAIAALGLVLGGCAFLSSFRPEDPALVGWKRDTIRLRDLHFQRRFQFRWVSRVELPGIISGIMEVAYPPGHIERYRDAYAALGVLPADIDLRAVLLELQEDQLLGLYDPASATLYVVTGEVDEDYKNATVVHELVHALQHQHFPELFAVQQGLRHNDDVLSGLGSAIEGDASFTMLARLPWTKRTVKSADLMREAGLIDLQHPDGQLAQVPRWMRDSLFFGYLYGTALAARFYQAQGNAGLDLFLTEPPLSTLRALDPQIEDPVEFIRLPLEPLRRELEARGCTLGHHNVAGALTLNSLFREHEGPKPAAGLDELLLDWRGDRFVHAQCGEQWELAWYTRWRSGAAAAAFATRYRSIAPAIAQGIPISGPFQIVRDGRTVLVHSEGLTPQRALLLDQSEVRAYPSFGAWLADDCFTEAPCPRPHSADAAAE